MDIRFVSGIAPIVRDMDASKAFYVEILGLSLSGDDYPATSDLQGVKHFGLWTLSEAARSCFGTDDWPAETPVPQASVEFDVVSVEAVGDAVKELTSQGHRLLVGPKTEEWGQTVARVLSPEGLLIGIAFTPWMHGES